MPQISAEMAYLFRHALVRDAAYQLMPPGRRAPLHALAFHLVEQMLGGPPPQPLPLDADGPAPEAHPTDAGAFELAEHAGIAGLRDGRVLYLRRAAEHAGRQHRNTEAAEYWGLLAGELEGATRAAALRRAGHAWWLMGQAARAEEAYGQALSAHVGQGDRRGEGVTLTSLAVLYGATGRIELAESALELALALHRESGNRKQEGTTIQTRGNVCRVTGRIREAEQLYLEALRIHRETGNRASEAVTLTNLGALYRDTNRPVEGESTLQQALALLREVNERRGEGIALTILCGLYGAEGRVDEAERLLSRALEIHRSVGNRDFEINAIITLAQLHSKRSRHADAETLLKRALALSREAGSEGDEAIVNANLAPVHAHRGDYERALELAEAGLKYFRANRDPHRAGLILIEIARWHGRAGWSAQVEAEFTEAVDLLTQVQATSEAAVCRIDLAMLQLGAGRVEQARKLWREAMGVGTEHLGRAQEMREACARAGVRPFDEAAP